MPTGELRLRLVVDDPVAGVAIQMQRGKDRLLPPTRSSASALVFDFTVRLGPTPKGLRFLGEFVQGPTSGRFVYVSSGKYAGQPASPWARRAKVSLEGITVTQARQVLDDAALVLEAHIAGRAKDAGPMAASVPLVSGGWAVRKAR